MIADEPDRALHILHGRRIAKPWCVAVIDDEDRIADIEEDLWRAAALELPGIIRSRPMPSASPDQDYSDSVGLGGMMYVHEHREAGVHAVDHILLHTRLSRQ